MLQGTNWQVQGSNGLNAAQLDQPWGSTLTFQPRVGVSWVHGLRHGVTMHPRGRHLREGRVPWSHGTSHTQAREQQPPHQPHYMKTPIETQFSKKEDDANCQNWHVVWRQGVNKYNNYYYKRQRGYLRNVDGVVTRRSYIEVECRAVSPHQPDKRTWVGNTKVLDNNYKPKW